MRESGREMEIPSRPLRSTRAVILGLPSVTNSRFLWPRPSSVSSTFPMTRPKKRSRSPLFRRMLRKAGTAVRPVW